MSKHLDSLIGLLHETGSLKVWSLIITFFGDSIVNRGGNVSANTVHTVLDRIDIGSGAVRTAFSRLVSDGWVQRQKLGRRSYFQLTEQGMRLFTDAAQRIYSPVDTTKQYQGSWLLGLHLEKSKLENFSIANVVVLPHRSILIFNPDKKTLKSVSELGFISVTGQLSDVPEWVDEHLRPADWEEQIQFLQDSFSSVASKPPTDPLSSLATRTLLIHQWRRLLLRYPPVPNALKGESLKLENESRKFVGDLYQQLTKPAELWLIEQGTCMQGALPDAQNKVTNRFTNQYLK